MVREMDEEISRWMDECLEGRVLHHAFKHNAHTFQFNSFGLFLNMHHFDINNITIIEDCMIYAILYSSVFGAITTFST